MTVTEIKASSDKVTPLLANCRDCYAKPIVEALFKYAVPSEQVIEPLLTQIHGGKKRKWNWTLVAVFALYVCFRVTSIYEISTHLHIDESTVKGYINLIYQNLGFFWEPGRWASKAQRREEAKVFLTNMGYLATNSELLVLILNF